MGPGRTGDRDGKAKRGRATGGPNADAVFLLAVYRASEICIGIVSAGIVLAGTDLGGTRRRLAALFAALTAEIMGRFTGMLALAGPDLPETQPARQELIRRVIALDPVIDVAIGESSQIRYHSPVLTANTPVFMTRFNFSVSIPRCPQKRPFIIAEAPIELSGFGSDEID